MLNAHSMTITKAQIKKIKALQSRLKMTDEEYRLLLSDEWVQSCRDLSAVEADRVIEKLQSRAIAEGVWQALGTGEWHGKTKYDELHGRAGFASPRQLRYIEGLWKETSRVQDNAKARGKALTAFVKRIAHVDGLRLLTANGAHQVIEALKEMKTQKEKTICPE